MRRVLIMSILLTAVTVTLATGPRNAHATAFTLAYEGVVDFTSG